MPQPRFQVSTADSFGAPGVYIKQVAVSAPLRGIFRGTTGYVGRTVKGPINKVVYCDSYQRFIDVFGGRDYGINGGAIIGDIWWALQGKALGKFYAVRCAAAAAVAASFTAETAAGGGGTAVLLIQAYGVGFGGNGIQWKVLPASNGVTTSFNLSIKWWDRAWLYENIDISTTLDNTAVVIGSDDAVPIRLTKVASGRPINNAASVDGADANGYTFLGQTVAAFTSVAGSDGTIADSDYIVGGGPMEILNNSRGIDSKMVAGRSNTAVKTKIFGLSATANLSLWFLSPDNETVTLAAFVTEVAGYRNAAVVGAFNHPYMIDPVTTVETVNDPAAQLVGILSQIEYDVHPGVDETSDLNQQITRLYNALGDPDRDIADANGITFLNTDVDSNNNNVFLFGNGRTLDLTVNNSQIDGERSKMYIIMGLAQRMRGDQNKPNTASARAKRAGAFSGWLTELAEAERFVDKDQSTGAPQYSIVNNDQVNTQTDRAAGIQRDLVQVRLIPKNIYMQLQVQAGTDVTITSVSQ